MQALDFVVAQNRAGGVVRRIDQQHACIAVNQLPNLIEIHAKLILAPQRIVANRNPERLRQGCVGGEARIREQDAARTEADCLSWWVGRPIQPPGWTLRKPEMVS